MSAKRHARIPITLSKGAYVIVDNPAYAGRTPRILTPTCHDRTPFVTIACAKCRLEMHVHESAVEKIPPTAKVGTQCERCREVIVLERDDLARAFARMREDGWIA